MALKGNFEERFDIKRSTSGRSKGCQEERILNSILRGAPNGWEIEADQRHVAIIAKQFNIQNGVTSPAEDSPKIEGDDDKYLCTSLSSQYRQSAGRMNYWSQDRPDIQFATKEVCRGINNPTNYHWRKLKRLGA